MLISGKLYYFDKNKEHTIISAEIVRKYNNLYKQPKDLRTTYITQKDILFFICVTDVEFPFIDMGQNVYEMFIFFHKDKIIGIDTDQQKYVKFFK